MKKLVWIAALAALAGAPLSADGHGTEGHGADEHGRGNVQIADIEMRFLYERSGTLSDDITAIKDFTAWNTLIGEGSAKEPASDVLVAVRMTAFGEVHDERTLTIRAFDSDRNPLAERTINGVGIKDSGYAHMLLEQSTCEGEIILEAAIGDQTMSEKIELFCGE